MTIPVASMKVERTYLLLDQRAGDLITKVRADPRDRFLPPELAEVLGISHSWINASRTQGYGPSYDKVGKRLVLYPKAAVIAWLQARHEIWLGRKGRSIPRKRAA